MLIEEPQWTSWNHPINAACRQVEETRFLSQPGGVACSDDGSIAMIYGMYIFLSIHLGIYVSIYLSVYLNLI